MTPHCIRRYQYVVAEDAAALSTEVTALLQAGWRLYGSPHLDGDWYDDGTGWRHDYLCAQALVREEACAALPDEAGTGLPI